VIALPAAVLDPATAARRAATGPGAFWLSLPDSDGVGIARDAIAAAPVRIERGTKPDDLDRLEDSWREERARWSAEGSPPPAGVPIAAGWWSYELGRRLLGLPPREDAPLYEAHFHDAVWVRGADGATIFARDEAAASRLARRLARDDPPRPATLGALIGDAPDAEFIAGVQRIRAYLEAGDAYQVNLSRRLAASCPTEAAVGIAALLRAASPAPHAAFIGHADGCGALIGNSPERFLALATDGAIETWPIKGTRPRGATPEADRRLAAALASAPKDRAEHVMIVDLERNDLGRVCRTGSVEVAALGQTLSLPTVHHMVSRVRGALRPDVGLAALLRATFPSGSVTGAPKRRAMQIIDELERVPRGPYTGATGWLGAAGDLDLAVAIRTAVVRDDRLTLSVGAGIVADSDPAAELAETTAKARAFAALSRA
jgi:anthranilate/para-aminobenzoate synthase component I